MTNKYIPHIIYNYTIALYIWLMVHIIHISRYKLFTYIICSHLCVLHIKTKIGKHKKLSFDTIKEENLTS